MHCLSFVGLHIFAVLYHQYWRKERLLQAMIREVRPGAPSEDASCTLACPDRWRCLQYSHCGGYCNCPRTALDDVVDQYR